MFRPPHALKERRDGSSGTQLTHQIHRADVDSQFQRGGGDQRFELPAFQTVLRVQPQLGRETAVMRGDLVRAESLRQMMGDSFSQSSRVDKHQRRPVRLDQIRQSLVNLRPDLVRHHGFQRRARQLDRQVHFPGMPRVNDGATRIAYFIKPAGADQESCDFCNRLLGRGQTDALQRAFHQRLQSFHAQRQVRPAPIADHSMNFIHDQSARRGEDLAPGFGGEQQIKRLGRRHENVRRLLRHGLSFRRRCVARADVRAQFNVAALTRAQSGPNSRQRFLQVFVNVVAERFEWRNIDHASLILELSGQSVAK